MGVVELRRALFAAYVEQLPPSRSTRNILRAALLRYWQLSPRRRQPPTGVLKVPRKPRGVCRALEEHDAVLLEKAALGAVPQPAGVAVLLGLYQALRRGEIARCRWDWWDWPAGELTVVGKGGAVDSIPIHPAMAEILADYPQRGLYLFPGRPPRPHVNPATVWEWTKKVASKAGISTTTHVLRHTCLATANDGTGDLRAVQHYARHTDPAVTTIYTRAHRRRLDAVVAAIRYS
ncbi:MAG: site-specific integrase [Actinomycetota bacterium]|nr:site-specific integrase [Actinomycetota bacterium]